MTYNTTPEVSPSVREEVFERDGHKCAICESAEKLHPHRITNRHRMPGGGDVPTNVITLCPTHRQQARVFIDTHGDEFVEGLRPDDLYNKISSSWREAMLDSKVGWSEMYRNDKSDDY